MNIYSESIAKLYFLHLELYIYAHSHLIYQKIQHLLKVLEVTRT